MHDEDRWQVDELIGVLTAPRYVIAVADAVYVSGS